MCTGLCKKLLITLMCGFNAYNCIIHDSTILFFFEPGKQLGKPPLLYFIKTQKTNTEQDKRKTLLVIQSEARTRRKTKNHLTQESTQERKTDRLFSKILYACSRASSSRDLLVSQADSYMTQAYMDMRKFTK